MTLLRNKSAAPQTVPGAGLAQPGGALEVPEDLAAGLSGPDWEPAEAATATEAPAAAGEETTPTVLLDEGRESEA